MVVLDLILRLMCKSLKLKTKTIISSLGISSIDHSNLSRRLLRESLDASIADASNVTYSRVMGGL
jgi:hypothetical protein